MNNWAERIKLRMKELDITQEALANKMGITRGAITHYLAGRRHPPLRQFQKLATILKADPAWLQFGTEATKPAQTEKETKEPTQHRLPILTWEQVSEYTDVTKIKRDQIKEYISHFYTDKPHWYALRVTGDSMTSPTGHIKNFHEGDLIIVDPEKEATHGDFVIALLPKSKAAIFKQYVVDGGHRYLKPLNPQYPIIPVDKGTYFCGTVIKNIRFW